MSCDSQREVCFKHGQTRALKIVFLLAVTCLWVASNLTAASNLYLVFPKVLQGTSEMTGVAVANPTEENASTILYLVSDDGFILDSRQIDIGPRSQLAKTLAELFPTYFSSSKSVDAWIFLESSNISVVGFFLSLTGTPGLTRIDGIDGAEATVVGPAFSGSLLFPDILSGPGQSTTIQLVAFDDSPVPVRLELYKPTGGSPVATRTVSIPADGGRYSTGVRTLFGPNIPARSFIKATAARGLVGFESFGTAQYTAARNALPFISEGLDLSFSLFGAQLVEGFGMTSEINLVNPTNRPATIKLTAFQMVDGNSVIAAERELTLLSNNLIKQPAGSLLDLPPDFVGWLRVDSNITGILGTISFGGVSGTYLSAVELQKSPVTDVVFSHVADGFGYFTGLTFVNISRDPANVQVEVYGTGGKKTGSGSFTLQPFEHRPQVLSQIIPGLKPQVGGFVLVKSDVGIFTFELFGYAPKGAVLALAAVPPQRGNGMFSGQLNLSKAKVSLEAGKPVGFPASRAKGITLDITSAFKPGELIAKFRKESLPSQVAAVSDDLNLRIATSAPDGLYLLKAPEQIGPVLMDSSPEGQLESRRQATLALIEQLNARPEILYAEPNYIASEDAVPNDPYLSYQWHYQTLKLEQAWDITTGSNTVTTAVIDSGVRTDHPDLAGRLTSDGYDLISDKQDSLDGDGIDPNPHDPGSDPQKKASSFHGSHVAGTIGALSNNGAGVAGVDWNTRIMAVRVLGAQGNGTYFDISQGIYYAAGAPNSSGKLPARPARVINLSLGGSQPSQTLKDAVDAALARRSVVVASAGNESTSAQRYPAEYPGVIKVGATDMAGNLAPYSNYGPRIDIVAPGGDTSQDLNGDGYQDGVLSLSWDEATNEPAYRFLNGTSMSSPHVAGVVALMLSIKPDLTPAQVGNILRTTAIDLGTPGRDDQFGYGLIDPVAALKAAGGQTQQSPELVLSAQHLDFGTELTQSSVTLSNGGGGTLSIEQAIYSTEDGNNWLKPQFSSVTTLLIEVDRSGLGTGRYRGQIQITSNGGNGLITIEMEVGTESISDIGQVYVFAIDPRTIDVINQATTNTASSLVYELPPTPTGDYLAIAGTDLDQNGLICETDDYCGIFPVFSDPELVKIQASQDRSSVDFSIGLLTGPTASALGAGRTPGKIEIRKNLVDLDWLSELFLRKQTDR